MWQQGFGGRELTRQDLQAGHEGGQRLRRGLEPPGPGTTGACSADVEGSWASCRGWGWTELGKWLQRGICQVWAGMCNGKWAAHGAPQEA